MQYPAIIIKVYWIYVAVRGVYHVSIQWTISVYEELSADVFHKMPCPVTTVTILRNI